MTIEHRNMNIYRCCFVAGWYVRGRISRADVRERAAHGDKTHSWPIQVSFRIGKFLIGFALKPQACQFWPIPKGLRYQRFCIRWRGGRRRLVGELIANRLLAAERLGERCVGAGQTILRAKLHQLGI